MKVAFLLPCLGAGGAERSVLKLSSYLAKEGFEVFILVLQETGDLIHAVHPQVKLINLKCGRTFQLPWRLWLEVRRLGIEVVVSSFWKLNFCSVLLKCFGSKVRVFLTEHCSPVHYANGFGFRFASLFYVFADGVVCVSHGVLRGLLLVRPNLLTKTKVIYNPILDVTLVSRSACKKMYSYNEKSLLGTNAIRIIFVGRLSVEKNPFLAVKVVELLRKERGMNCDLMYVGDGPIRSELESYIKKSDASSFCTMIGYSSDPLSFMRESDLLLLTSYYEGLPSVLLEALSVGLRIVSTPCDGVQEILGDNQYGSIALGFGAAEVADAVVRELSIFARSAPTSSWFEKFASERIIDRYINLFKSRS